MRSVLRSLCSLGCALLLAVAAVSATALPAVAAAPTGWLHTKGSRILDSKNADHVIRATSWFGMETANCAPHGLWQIKLDDGMAEIASFGFNAIRLPYSNECLAATETSGIDLTLNPALKGLTPLQVMDAFVASAKAHGLSVILDRHRPDSGAQSELWYTSTWSESRWISDWTMLARRYAKDPTVVGVDLHNEPHGTACWGCGDPKRDWAAAATRAGNAVLAVNPRLLIVVEGVEQQKSSKTWWGGGLADAKKHPVKLKVANRLVYSTHDYPASVFAQPWFSAKNYPKNLPGVWKASWGYLQESGTAPVLLGEFGTKLETTSDQQWLTTLVEYVRKNKMSFAYWSFNPNSGDTGGLVKDDWRTPQQAKLDVLRPILGKQTPFTPSTKTTKPTPGSTTQRRTSGPQPEPTPSASAAPSTPAPSASPSAEPSVAPSEPTASPSEPASSTSPGTATGTADGTTADWKVQSSWPGGYVAELTVSSEQARQGWTVSWPDAEASSVVNAWGMTCTDAAGTISCSGDGWGGDLRPGQPVRVGVQVATPGTAPTAPTLTVS
nr:cellulase family glycosylhydrolase [Microlunatus antarcticus]